MTLDKFMGLCLAWDNKDGSWSVVITLKDKTKCRLTIDRCDGIYDAKERAFLFLKEEIRKSIIRTTKGCEHEIINIDGDWKCKYCGKILDD